MMRNAATTCLASAFLLAAGTGLVEARPDVRTMTCQQAQDTVEQSGAVVMNTGTHTYQRFVSRDGNCDPHEEAVYERVQTADDNACRMRICQPRERFGF